MTHGGAESGACAETRGCGGGAGGGRLYTVPTQALRADVRPATQSCAGAPRPRHGVGFSPLRFAEAVLLTRVVP